jgi:hypothetical protein
LRKVLRKPEEVNLVKSGRQGKPMQGPELVETIMIFIALLSLMPVAYWWHTQQLGEHHSYFYYLFFMLCILGYITYRRIKRLRAVMKSTKKKGSGPRVPPFFG